MPVLHRLVRFLLPHLVLLHVLLHYLFVFRVHDLLQKVEVQVAYILSVVLFHKRLRSLFLLAFAFFVVFVFPQLCNLCLYIRCLLLLKNLIDFELRPDKIDLFQISVLDDQPPISPLDQTLHQHPVIPMAYPHFILALVLQVEPSSVRLCALHLVVEIDVVPHLDTKNELSIEL